MSRSRLISALVLLLIATAGCGGGSGQSPEGAEQAAPTPRRVILTGGPFPALGIDTVFDVGEPFAAFEVFSGLGSASELVEVDEPNSSFLRLEVGRSSFSNITLKRGVVSDAFQTWRKQIEVGTDTRIDLKLTLFNDDGKPVRAFMLRGASVLRSNPATSDSNTAMTEEIEMVIERIERG